MSLDQPDLFSVDPTGNIGHALDAARWPAQLKFPVNRATVHVADVVRSDLLRSARPLVVAGYSSIGELVDFVASWSEAHDDDAQVRLLLGAEPYPTARVSFGSAKASFTEEARRYWEERGISIRLSAKVLQAIGALDSGRLTSRFIHGATTLHAKVYIGRDAATTGSSNFSDAGLRTQLEVNVRFEREQERDRFDGLVMIAENLWAQGQPWDDEFRALLEALLRFTTWQEAIASATADLLEGEWAAAYLEHMTAAGGALWPSQRAGIAQTLWIIETVGSALIADATGSGKTRMGAHLVRAVRDRLWSTGRARRGRAVVVCPPAVAVTWEHEANVASVDLLTISHGLLSREASTKKPRSQEEALAHAQIVAVDEAHNFLNRDARRTQQVRDNRADHVLLFTATPINRGAADLLALVAFLGADNFDDPTIETLRRLERRRSRDAQLSTTEVDNLRKEIQRFTVRRTKAVLNELVDREPVAYLDPSSGRTCRYPEHDARTYDTGETPGDEVSANEVRALSADLIGIAQLERTIAVPPALRQEYSDDRWLAFRLASVTGLAAYHVLGAMRSSRAAVIEHLEGTARASARYGLPRFKAAPTGDVIGKVGRLADDGPPAVELDCDVPNWLTDRDAWSAACAAERSRYEAMLAAASRLSPAREERKADLLLDLARRHPRLLAFDRHPITLEQLHLLLDGRGPQVIVATGANQANRRRVEEAFDRESSVEAIALCSDAMNEGLNLQGASAIVHLDLPTTLRVAEQRIGRVDRMDSPHDAIEAWWPRDGKSFATRANELLAQRAAESQELLGSNLRVPILDDRDDIVDVEERIREAEAPGAEAWDGIRDALDPVRRLVSGSDPLVPREVYEEVRSAHRRTTVLSAVASPAPWAFLAIAATADGAPRWLLLDGERLDPITGLDNITAALRTRLAADPPAVAIEDALPVLDGALDAAARAEHELLPRRMQRALDQLRRVTARYARDASRQGDEVAAQRWSAIGSLADPSRDGARPDPYTVAERWLTIVRPHLDAERARRRFQQFVLLREIDKRLETEPLALATVEAAFGKLTAMAPLDDRVVACVLGVPVVHEPIGS
ncbi:MAG TPA: SNF2-related protein, partial [Nannocystaceae bacterium]|nr:SNF2-related protein [Nannocystaceae bacterium]